MLLDADVFETITSIAEKGNFNIVEFKGIISKIGKKDFLNNKMYDTRRCDHPLNLVLYQPQLGRYQIWPSASLNGFRLGSIYLWAKCFRTIIYKNATPIPNPHGLIYIYSSFILIKIKLFIFVLLN